jgi:peptidyl-prolyl cis-trans isomerase D
MLTFIRRNLQSVFVQAIVVIIALVFIFWGVGTNLMNQGEAAIIVNGQEIGFAEYEQTYDQLYQRIATQFGGSIPRGFADSLGLEQQAISQLIQQALLRQGGRDMELAVYGDELADAIESMVQFQENGVFNENRYNEVLAVNRLSPVKFENSMRTDLLADKTIGAVSSFILAPTDFEIDALYRLENGAVRVNFVEITADDVIDSIIVDEQELSDWFAANAVRYQDEAKVKLTYLGFAYDALGEMITVDQQAIVDYYEQHLPEYQIPEQRRARHILLQASETDSDQIHEEKRALAEQLRERLLAGEDFSELATSYSEGPTAQNGGDLGFFGRGQMVAPFEEAVFSLSVGEISEVVQTGFGYHIIILDDIRPGSIESLDEVKDDIVAAIATEQAKPLALQSANEAYEAIIRAGSLDEYLNLNPDAPVRTTEFFGRSQPPEGIAANPRFLDQAFSLQQGELSSVVQTDEGLAIIYASAVQQPEIPELAAVRERAETDFIAEQARLAARAKAEEIRSALAEDGQSLAELAGAHNLTVQDSGNLRKNDPDYQSPFPRSLVNETFTLSPAQPVADQVGEVGDGFYVYTYMDRSEPESPITDDQRQRLQETIAQFRQQQLVDGWVRHQQDQAKITLHPRLQALQ